MTDDHDDILRDALRAEADGVHAGPEMLERIRGGTTRRPVPWRARGPWLAGVAALAVAVGLTAAVLTREDGGQTLDVIDDETTSTSGPVLPPDLTPPTLCRGDQPDHLAVYLHPGITDDALAAMAERLDTDPRVAIADYRDQDDVFDEFQELFADSPELLEAVAPDILPSRYDVTVHDPADREALDAALAGAPGVYEIVDASEVCGEADVTDRPAPAVAVTAQGRIVVVDTTTGDVIRDLGGFDDPTDPAAAEREGGAFSITGVALHPNGQDVYFETCCEPAAGAIFRVPLDGSVPVDPQQIAPVAYGYGIDISADGRWLTYVHAAGMALHHLETDTVISAPQTDDMVDFVQAAVNSDGSEVTVERALERGEDGYRVVRSELVTYRRVGDTLERTGVSGGDTRLLPIYADGALAQVPARDGVIDVNIDASGRWFLVTPADMSLRGYTRADDAEEIPGGPYVAADW